MASLTPASVLPLHSHARCNLSSRSVAVLATSGDSRPDREPAAAKGASSAPEKAFLKAAWYGSELLGIAASLFRPGAPVSEKRRGLESLEGGAAVIGRDRAVEAIKEDFKRSYFVTGNLTLNAYEEDCEFADPAGSFTGLSRFKRNCTNFGSLLVKASMKLTKWEDFEDKAIGHWRFSCIMSFPWRPILSATGYTEYHFAPQSGKACGALECSKDSTLQTVIETHSLGMGPKLLVLEFDGQATKMKQVLEIPELCHLKF